jgi:Replicase family/Primase C terminal 1 (PriCT-1)
MNAEIEGPAFEAWSTDPEIWPKQFEAALAAKGFHRSRAVRARPRKAGRAKPREISEGTAFWQFLPWQQAFVATLPAYMDCAGDFRLGTFKRERDLALNFPHIQFNSPTRKVWLPFYVDREDAETAHERAGVAVPNLIIKNPENGHAHLAYQLIEPVTYYVRSRQTSVEYLADIQRGMIRRLDADKAFAGHLLKNPLSERWNTLQLRDEAYSLAELASYLGRVEMRRWDAGERECGLGRNVMLFDRLRHVAYCEVRRFMKDGATQADFRAQLQSIAASLNHTSGFLTPLALSEVNGIAKSVSGWTWKNFSADLFSDIQRARIKKRWAGHVPLHESRPWEAEGVCRRTWFYRKARAASEANAPLSKNDQAFALR